MTRLEKRTLTLARSIHWTPHVEVPRKRSRRIHRDASSVTTERASWKDHPIVTAVSMHCSMTEIFFFVRRKIGDGQNWSLARCHQWCTNLLRSPAHCSLVTVDTTAPLYHCMDVWEQGSSKSLRPWLSYCFNALGVRFFVVVVCDDVAWNTVLEADGHQKTEGHCQTNIFGVAVADSSRWASIHIYCKRKHTSLIRYSKHYEILFKHISIYTIWTFW